MTAAVPSVRLHDGEKPATYHSIGSAYALDVSIVDSSGSPVLPIASTFSHGSMGGITTGAVQISPTAYTPARGVLVKADTSNVYKVVVGLAGVTMGSTTTTDGIELLPGDSLTLEVDNVNKIYVRGNTTTACRIMWVAV